jgi:hypothetical protein
MQRVRHPERPVFAGAPVTGRCPGVPPDRDRAVTAPATHIHARPSQAAKCRLSCESPLGAATSRQFWCAKKGGPEAAF